jgi:hypothetical protein
MRQGRKKEPPAAFAAGGHIYMTKPKMMYITKLITAMPAQ